MEKPEETTPKQIHSCPRRRPECYFPTWLWGGLVSQLPSSMGRMWVGEEGTGGCSHLLLVSREGSKKSCDAPASQKLLHQQVLKSQEFRSKASHSTHCFVESSESMGCSAAIRCVGFISPIFVMNPAIFPRRKVRHAALFIM